MGCGKSSVGRRLSQLLCCPFMDLDQVIEEREGRSIPDIFSRDGEPEFRRIELEALKHIVGERPSLVLALGGGAVMTAECAEIVHFDTLCIYLKASVETLMEHLSGQTDSRPLLNTHDCHSDRAKRVEESALRDRITKLMALRSDTYEKTAHIIIDTDGKSIDSICQEIISTVAQ